MIARSLVAALLVCAAPALAEVPGPDADEVEEGIAQGPAIGDKELAPYFASGWRRAASARLQEGRPDLALELIPLKPKDFPGRWLRAAALRGTGRGLQAKAAYEQIAAAGGPLSDRAMHLAALSALEAGNAEAAEALFGKVRPRYVDADQALLERARQTQKLRPPGPETALAVEAVLKPILSGEVRGDVGAAHLVAGDAQLAAGVEERARAHWRATWVEHPLSLAAPGARQRELALSSPADPIPAARLVRRAEILLDAHRNRDALDQLGRLDLPSLCAGGCPGDQTPSAIVQTALELLAPGSTPVQHQPTPEEVARPPRDPADSLACRAKFDQGRGLRKEREYGKARAALAPVVLRCGDADLRARALYLLAQIETILGNAQAGPLWEALHRNFPQSNLADDAVFSQALVRRRAGDFGGDRVLLQDLVDLHPDSDLRSEALFRLFWSHFAEGHPRRGLVYLDQLAAHPDVEGAEEERARYWRARTLLDPDPDRAEPEQAQAAAREAARADLLWLVEQRPLTYHGLLARGRLSDLDGKRARALEAVESREVAAALRSRPALHAGPLARDPHFNAAVELIRLGMKAEAARELLAVDREPARGAGDLGDEALVLLADLSARAGDLRNAHAIVRIELRSLLRRTSEPLALRAASLAYPLAFRDQIAKASRRASVPKDLLQALMREESALDPKALSSTGALGLTQLMPGTAKDVARRLRLRGFSNSHLLDPDVNIRMGATYLGELLARFQHPALALAGYNAGPGTVAGWMKQRGALQLDAFVEEIPLDETRGYVKRCLRSFAAYQYLYGTGRSRAPQVGQILAQPKQETRRNRVAARSGA